MCDNCFTNEIESFADEKSWTSFDLELTKKLGRGKMKHLKFVPDGLRDKDDGQDIYECLTCRQKWKMKDPDNAFRGCFLKLSTLDKVTTRLTTWQILSLSFLGLVIVRLIYEILRVKIEHKSTNRQQKLFAMAG